MRDNHPFVRGRRTGKLAPLEALTEVRCTIARRVLREKVATNAGYELTPLGDIKYLNQVSGDSNWIQIGTKKGGGRLFYRFEKGTVELQRLTEAEFQQASRYTSMHFNELVQEYKVMEAKGVFRTLHAGNPLTDIRQHIQHLVDRYGFTPPWQKPNWFQRIFRRAA
jgi:AraC-like DNA-binding protein